MNINDLVQDVAKDLNGSLKAIRMVSQVNGVKQLLITKNNYGGCLNLGTIEFTSRMATIINVDGKALASIGINTFESPMIQALNIAERARSALSSPAAG